MKNCRSISKALFYRLNNLSCKSNFWNKIYYAFILFQHFFCKRKKYFCFASSRRPVDVMIQGFCVIDFFHTLPDSIEEYVEESYFKLFWFPQNHRDRNLYTYTNKQDVSSSYHVYYGLCIDILGSIHNLCLNLNFVKRPSRDARSFFIRSFLRSGT